MSFLFVISVIYIALYACQAVLSCFSKRIWTQGDQRALWLFAVCLVVTAGFVVPDSTTDLSRYHAEINWLRQRNSGFTEAEVLSISTRTSALYLHVLILYIVSKCSSNCILQMIWCSITYGVWAYTIKKFTGKYKPPVNQVYTGILLFFGVTSYFACVSNMRYPCLCVLFFYAVYMKVFENKNYALILVTIVGAGIHVSILMMLGIWGLVLLSKKTNLYRLVVFWTVFVNLLITVLEKMPVTILNYVGEKLYYYFNVYDEQLTVRLRVIYGVILILLLVGLVVIRRHGWKRLDEGMRRYYQFIECLLLFAIGSFVNDTMLIRSMILLGPSLMPYAHLLMPAFKKKNQIAFVYLFLGSGLIALSLVSIHTFFSFSV